MKYYIGVDGGGTKTKIAVCDHLGNVISQATLGTSNPNDIGVDNLIDLLKDAIETVLPEDADSFDVSLGLSGMSYAGAKDKVLSALKEIPFANEVYLESDIRIALDACYPNKDGAIAIIGTGNAVYLRKNKEYKLLGGAGYMFDHTLSGYDLGEKVISAIIRDNENRGPKTSLTEAVLKDNESIKKIVGESYKQGKAYVASFAHYAVDSCSTDKVAESIVRECVSNFESLLDASFVYVDEISLVGGLTRKWDVFSKYLSKPMNVKVADTDPIVGAFVRFDVYDEKFRKTLVKSL